jgi:SAM-dependent methyltransferase
MKVVPSSFRDHFSTVAAGYAAHRPKYPAELLDFLASIAPARRAAWDVGCGSGQLSVALASRFERVLATDASPQQIAKAEEHPRVEYRAARAESSGLPDACADLVVAAQAAHWFDRPAFYAEARRVARPDAAIALATYAWPSGGADVDPIVHRFYSGPIGPFWPPERRHTEDGYRSIEFPFEEIAPPPLEVRVEWDLAGFLGYVETWSAVLAFVKAEGRAQVDHFRAQLAEAWGPPERVRTIRWPLSLRAGRIGTAATGSRRAAPAD